MRHQFSVPINTHREYEIKMKNLSKEQSLRNILQQLTIDVSLLSEKLEQQKQEIESNKEKHDLLLSDFTKEITNLNYEISEKNKELLNLRDSVSSKRKNLEKVELDIFDIQKEKAILEDSINETKSSLSLLINEQNQKNEILKTIESNILNLKESERILIKKVRDEKEKYDGFLLENDIIKKENYRISSQTKDLSDKQDWLKEREEYVREAFIRLDVKYVEYDSSI